MPTLLAYRPFLDPINIHETWWLFLIPLALGVSVTYKAVRVKSMDHYARNVIFMTLHILAAMVALAALSYLFVMVYVQYIAQHSH